MNWKKHAYLFTNGKFKIQVGETICDIIAWNTHGRFSLYGDEERKEIKLMHCTLIARKIEDMSNSEVFEALQFQEINHEHRDFKFYKSWLEGCVSNWVGYDDDWNKERLSAECQNYLLSLGVYPFPWDGTVIDIKTLTEEHKECKPKSKQENK